MIALKRNRWYKFRESYQCPVCNAGDLVGQYTGKTRTLLQRSLYGNRYVTHPIFILRTGRKCMGLNAQQIRIGEFDKLLGERKRELYY